MRITFFCRRKKWRPKWCLPQKTRRRNFHKLEAIAYYITHHNKIGHNITFYICRKNKTTFVNLKIIKLKNFTYVNFSLNALLINLAVKQKILSHVTSMVQAWTSTVISIERLQTLISIERLSDDIARLFLPIFMLRGKLFGKTAVVTCQPVYMFAALGWIPAVSEKAVRGKHWRFSGIRCSGNYHFNIYKLLSNAMTCEL